MLNQSTVYRKLDAKFKIGGVEATDLLMVLIVAAVMNLFFGRFSFGPLLIFGIPGLLFCALYFGKRGKPEMYLMHAVRYHLEPGALMAGDPKDFKI